MDSDTLQLQCGEFRTPSRAQAETEAAALSPRLFDLTVG